jgi:MFS family permease
LALAAFAIGTTEFVIMGILPDVARDLGVSISSAGLLVSGHALGVAVGAPLLAMLTARWPEPFFDIDYVATENGHKARSRYECLKHAHRCGNDLSESRARHPDKRLHRRARQSTATA